MTNSRTGHTPAAGYGHSHVLHLRQAARSAQQSVECEQEFAARQQALCCMNKAIRTAMLAQLDDHETGGAADDVDFFMHADGCGCYSYSPVTRGEGMFIS